MSWTRWQTALNAGLLLALANLLLCAAARLCAARASGDSEGDEAAAPERPLPQRLVSGQAVRACAGAGAADAVGVAGAARAEAPASRSRASDLSSDSGAEEASPRVAGPGQASPKPAGLPFFVEGPGGDPVEVTLPLAADKPAERGTAKQPAQDGLLRVVPAAEAAEEARGPAVLP